MVQGTTLYKEVQNKINKNPLTQQINQTIDLNGITNIEASGKRVYIFVSAATNTPAFVSGRQIDLDHVEIKTEDATNEIIE